MMASLFQISYLIGMVHGCSQQLIAITEVEYKEIFNSTTHYVSVNVEDGIHCIHSCQTGNIHVCVGGGGGGTCKVKGVLYPEMHEYYFL